MKIPDEINFVVVARQYDEQKKEVVFIEKANPAGVLSFEYRFEILRNLEAGMIYYTGALIDNAFSLGPQLNLVHVNGAKYLRVDKRVIPEDDFTGVPEL